MKQNHELAIIDSWYINSGPWIEAVHGDEIKTRILVTNKAVVDVILELNPRDVLDAGCGEGWLVRDLERNGIDALGIDAIPRFVESAISEGKGRFLTLAYNELCNASPGESFDVLVCNFSLFGKESVSSLFRIAPQLLNKEGSFVVQTLHPVQVQNGEKWSEGWRNGSWDGFNTNFSKPAPWYFRTLESWKDLFKEAGFGSLNIVEPINPETGEPASMIFVGSLCG